MILPIKILVILQMVLHIPFSYYIGKEYLMVAIEETYKMGMSKTVDRIIKDF